MPTQLTSAPKFKAKPAGRKPVAKPGPARRAKRRTSEGMLRGALNVPVEELLVGVREMWDWSRRIENFEL
jgi:hypothetical protein